MQDRIGLRFLFGQQFLAVVVSKEKAREIIKMYKMKSDAVVYDEEDTWAVRLSSVMTVHTFDPDQVQQQAQAPGPPPGVPGAPPVSGGNKLNVSW